MRTFYACMSLLLIGLGAGRAAAQHEGDLAVGRSAARQLKLKAYDPQQKCFDPNEGVALLTYIPASKLYRAVDPGFDANFTADPNQDFHALDPGAEIWLVAHLDMPPAFYVEYQGQTIRQAGDDILLGSSSLHRHVRWTVNEQDPAFDPVRTLWPAAFVLEDRGTTQYATSSPFALRFAIVECMSGDVNADSRVDFDDINPFVAVLTDPPAAPPVQRCAADANRDGYVSFADINAFVALLAR